jgi:hypothetical protein
MKAKVLLTLARSPCFSDFLFLFLSFPGPALVLKPGLLDGLLLKESDVVYVPGYGNTKIRCDDVAQPLLAQHLTFFISQFYAPRSTDKSACRQCYISISTTEGGNNRSRTGTVASLSNKEWLVDRRPYPTGSLQT